MSISPFPSGAPALKPMELIVLTFRAFGRHLPAVLLAAPAPMLLYYLIFRLPALLGLEAIPDIVLQLGGLVALAAFAVACHRIVALGPAYLPLLGIAVDRRLALYVVRMVPLAVAMMPPTLIGVALLALGGGNPVAMLLGLAMLAGALTVGVRLGLALPAVALDEPGGLIHSFTLAWRRGRKGLQALAMWSLFAVFFLGTVSTVAMDIGLAGLVAEGGTLDAESGMNLLRAVPRLLVMNMLVEFTITGYMAVGLTVAFMRLSGFPRGVGIADLLRPDRDNDDEED